MCEGYIPFNSPWWLKWYEQGNRKHKVRVSDPVKLTQVSKISGVMYCEQCGVMLKQLDK